MSSLFNSSLHRSVFGTFISIILDLVYCFGQECSVGLVMVSVITKKRQSYWLQEASGVQALSCGLIEEDVLFCGPSHKFQPLDPFCILIICVDNLMSSQLSSMSEVSMTLPMHLLTESCLGL